MSLIVDINTGQPQLPRGPHQQFTGTIGASSTLVIDSVTLAQFSRLDYTLSFYDNGETVTKNMKFVVNKTGSTISDQVFSRLGVMDIEVNSVVNAGEYNLSITNSEAFAVNYCLTVLTA